MENPARYVVDRPAPPSGVVLMQCPLAGFQFYAAETCWRQMRVRDPLALVREPGNRHDPRAVRIEWQGMVLGYVPRDANYTISQMLDRGHEVTGRIAALQQIADPWKRIMVEIEWPGDRSAAVAAPVRRPSTHALHDVAIVDLGAFVTGAPPSKIDFAKAIEGLDEDAKRIAAIALARSSADIIGRLAMPVTGVTTAASRSVQLWGLLEITMTHDGRTLAARFLHGKEPCDALSANLATPVSNAAWVGPFERIVGTMAARLPDHWLERTLRRTYKDFVDFTAMRRAILDFLAPDELTRSLANRIFDDAPTAAQFNWVGRHRDALCLDAIEHPALMPFLRWVEIDGRFLKSPPMPGLTALLVAAEGMQPGALKRLERWGYEPFSTFAEELPGEPSLAMLVGFANLLGRLGVAAAPPAFFSSCAGAVARVSAPPVFGASVPDWFMRAMLRGIEDMIDDEDEIAFGEQLMAAMPWIASRPPEPDSNQCKAGWPWIMERVRQFEICRAKGEWPPALEVCVIGGYRVVPIHTLAQLKREAQEMKNCLGNYAEECRCGGMAIFSIRTVGYAGGKRVANLAAVRGFVDGRTDWSLHQVAGKMNADVSSGVEAVARAVVAALNSGAASR